MFTRWIERQNPWAELDAFRQRMERIFAADERETSTRSLFSRSGWPAMALYDHVDRLDAQVDVPGLAEKSIKVTLTQNVLNVEAKRDVDLPKGYPTRHRRERPVVEFSRSFALPCRVDAERVNATVRDGVLSVVMEKVAEAQPKQITVKAR